MATTEETLRRWDSDYHKGGLTYRDYRDKIRRIFLAETSPPDSLLPSIFSKFPITCALLLLKLS